MGGPRHRDTLALNTGRLLRQILRTCGVGEVYGASRAGLDVVPVDAGLAGCFADAHERVHGERAAVHTGDGVVVVDPGAADDTSSTRLVVRTDADLTLVGEALALRGVELQLALDLTRPSDVAPAVPAGTDERAEPAPGDLDQVRAARRVAVLCGPGVVRDGAVWALHELAAAGGLGVLNTWGAKGVFDWRSGHHWATVGLQRDDFALGGLSDTDLVVATGLDPWESPAHRWEDLAPHVSVVPRALALLAERWPLPRRVPGMPPLRERLSRVTQAGWEDTRVPLLPSRVTSAYSRVFGSGGLVAADPGTAGYWVARTFATTRLRSAHVPARAEGHGTAAACCAVARLRCPTRPVLAVVDAPVRDEVREVVEAAARLGVAVPVEVWDADGDRLDPGSHAERLVRAATGSQDGTFRIATDSSQLDRMIEVAGPVVAWT